MTIENLKIVKFTDEQGNITYGFFRDSIRGLYLEHETFDLAMDELKKHKEDEIKKATEIIKQDEVYSEDFNNPNQ